MAAPSPKQRAVALKRGGMDDGMVGAVLGISADDVRSLLYDAEPTVELGGDETTELQLFKTTVDLSYDQYQQLPSTSVELLPAPTDGLWLPFWAFLHVGDGFGQWDNLDTNSYMVVHDTESFTRRLARGEPSAVDGLYGVGGGGGLLLAPEQSISFPLGAYPQGQNAVTQGRCPEAAFGGGLSLFHADQFAELEPHVEGGYGDFPDSAMTVTVAYALIED